LLRNYHATRYSSGNVLNYRFLLAARQIQTVLEQPSTSKRRKSLKTMPERLENSFQATINKIKRQSTVKANQGMEILKWTYFAQRPLRIFELRHALVATNSTSDTLDLDDLPFEKSLTECCHGLVIIDKST
jgi:hypothetical protein